MKRRRRWWTRTNIESKNLIPWLCMLKRLLRIKILTLRRNYILLAFHLKSKKVPFWWWFPKPQPLFQTGLQETSGSMGWKEMEIVGLVWEQCLARLGYTLFFSYPKASTRLEIRTSVKHGLDQILTSTQPQPVPQLSVGWALTPTQGLFGVIWHLRLLQCFAIR